MREFIVRFKEKYNSIPKAAKASFWAIICSVLQKGISLITTPIFTRILSTEEYGLVSLYDSWYMVIIVFTSLYVWQNSFNNAMIKYTTEEERNKYVSSVLCMVSLFSIVFGCLAIAFYDLLVKYSGFSYQIVIIMALELFFAPAYSLWAAKKRFNYDYIGVVIFTIIISVMSPFLGLIGVVIFEDKAFMRILGFASVQIVIGVIFFVYNLIKGKCIFDSSMWKFALRLNVPLIPYYISSIILSQADRIMINYICGKTENAIYSLAYTTSLLMVMFSNAINVSLGPYIYKSIAKNNYDGLKKNINILPLFVLSINVFLMLLGPELIKILGPDEYESAKWVIPPVSASVFLIFLYQLFGNIVLYKEKTIIMSISSVIVAVLNIILNYFCIQKWGFVAAGYTTLASYFVLVIIYYTVYKIICIKYMGKQELYDDKMLIIFTIIALSFVGITSMLYYMNDIYRYISIAVIIVIIVLLLKKTYRSFIQIRGDKNDKKDNIEE